MGKINQRTGARLLFAPQRGFVKEDLEDKAEEIVELARDKISEILGPRMANNQLGLSEILDSVDYEIIQRGFIMEARIGIRNTGEASRYLARKESTEHAWLRPAIEEVMGG